MTRDHPPALAPPPQRSGRRALGPLLDRAGVVASSLCAVHCAATPALLAAAPALGVVLGEGAWEWPFLCASCVVGAAALVPSFRRSGRAIALVVFVAGAASVLAAKLCFAGGAAEGALSALGAAGIASAHWLNLRVVRGGARAAGAGGAEAGRWHSGGGACAGSCEHLSGASVAARSWRPR